MPTPGAATSPFSKRLTIALSVLAGLCLVGSVILGIATSDPPATQAGSDSTNRSALGHSALVELLRDVGYPVVVSRSRTARRSESASLVLVLEPVADSGPRQFDALAALLGDARCPVVVALPKWRADDTEAVGEDPLVVARRSDSAIRRVLRDIEPTARLVTVDAPAWTHNDLGPAEPVLPNGTQLFAAENWEPALETATGLLVGERFDEAGSVALVADPDLFANHSLHEPANAKIALAIVKRYRRGDGPILIDETMHGLGVADSFWAQIFEFPLVLATIQAAIAAVLLLLAGMRRFGAPAPWTPAFPPGSRFLIDHVAGLLESGGHHSATLERYLAAVQDRAMHDLVPGNDAPRALAREEARSRVTETLSALDHDVRELSKKRPRDARAAHKIALRLWRWKTEMKDGPRRGSGPR